MKFKLLQHRVQQVRIVRGGRSAFSLLEVILAIAILGGALVVLGELMRIGSRSAMEAREMTTAQLYCESKMAEVVAGITPADAVGPVPFEQDPDWKYTIASEAGQQDGIRIINVTMEQELRPAARPVSFTLTRWVLDPQRTITTDATDSSSSTGSSSTGGGSTSSGAGNSSSSPAAGGS